MSQVVYEYRDAEDLLYQQASIYLDACFILAFFGEDDEDGSRVEQFLQMWVDQGIEKLGISNHVYGEVVYHLFKQQIHRALTIACNLIKNPNAQLTNSEEDELGDEDIAKRMLNLLDYRIKQRLLNEEDDVKFSVPKLIKDIKWHTTKSERYRLNTYYQQALDRFNQTIEAWRETFKLNIEILPSNEDDQDWAGKLMSDYRLEPYDALHLAIAINNGYLYFATLDGDFIDVFHDTNKPSISILKIS